MTKDEANKIYAEVWPEIHARLTDARIGKRKLLDYEAVMLIERSKDNVRGQYPGCTDPETLKSAALLPFAGLHYVRGSRFAVKPMKPRPEWRRIEAGYYEHDRWTAMWVEKGDAMNYTSRACWVVCRKGEGAKFWAATLDVAKRYVREQEGQKVAA